MKKTLLQALAIAAVLSPAVAFTQSGKTKPTTATYITKEEVDTVNKNGQGIDRNIKVVDIGHENYTVGIIFAGGLFQGTAFAMTLLPRLELSGRIGRKLEFAVCRTSRRGEEGSVAARSGDRL